MDLFAVSFKLTGQGVAEANQALAGVTQAGAKATTTLTGAEQASQRSSAALKDEAASARAAARGYDEVAARAPFIKQLSDAIARAQGVSRNAFSAIQRDIQLATADFRAGRISVEDYRAALDHARQSAIALSQQAGTLSGGGLGAFNAVLRQTEQKTLTTAHGFSQMERGLALLAGEAIGANAGLERLATGALLFGVGGPVTIAVLGGLLAIGLAYRALTSEARKAEQAVDDVKKAIDRQLAADVPKRIQAQLDLNKLLRDREEIEAKLLDIEAKQASLRKIGAGEDAVLTAVAQKLRQDLFDADVRIARQRRTLADAEREAAADRIDKEKKLQDAVLARAEALAQAIRLDSATNAERREAVQLADQLLARSRDEHRTVVQRNADAQAAAAIEQALAAVGKDRLKIVRDETEALARRAEIATQNLRTQGASAESVAALRAVEQELTAALGEENRRRLESLGLLPQLLALIRAEAEARRELAQATEGVQPRALSFGLGGVTPAAGRSLTAPLGEGLRQGFQEAFASQVFGGALQQFARGMTALAAGIRFHIRLVGADVKDLLAEHLGRQLAGAAQGAIEGIAVGIANALGEVLAAGGNFGKAMLATFGGAIASFGRALVTFAVQMKLALSALASLNPVAAIAIGFAMIALGSALGGLAKAARQEFGGGGSAGGLGPTEPIRVVMVDTSVRAASRVQQPSPTSYHFTIVGPSDPQAQRQIREIIRQADRRNLPNGI